MFRSCEHERQLRTMNDCYKSLKKNIIRSCTASNLSTFPSLGNCLILCRFLLTQENHRFLKADLICVAKTLKRNDVLLSCYHKFSDTTSSKHVWITYLARNILSILNFFATFSKLVWMKTHKAFVINFCFQQSGFHAGWFYFIRLYVIKSISKHSGVYPEEC